MTSILQLQAANCCCFKRLHQMRDLNAQRLAFQQKINNQRRSSSDCCEQRTPLFLGRRF